MRNSPTGVRSQATMIPFRVIRSGMLLAGLLLSLAWPLAAAEGGFVARLTNEQMAEAGLTMLTPEELDALDQLVAGDQARVRQLNTSALPGRFSGRHSPEKRAAAGLDRLSAGQLAKLDELVDGAVYTRPSPKERPRLKDGDVLSEQGRLRVHGGMSFTYGWAGGGRSFRESSAWVSYHDPVTGLSLGFGFSNFSGDGFYPGYYYDRDYYSGLRSYSTRSRVFLADGQLPATVGSLRTGFKGDGASFRAPVVASRGSSHPRGPGH
jgi:hypothetical protein